MFECHVASVTIYCNQIQQYHLCACGTVCLGTGEYMKSVSPTTIEDIPLGKLPDTLHLCSPTQHRLLKIELCLYMCAFFISFLI
jgi:hypothetical protein